MSSRDDKRKKEKEKRDKEKNQEKFDSNIDTDTVKGGNDSESSNSSTQKATKTPSSSAGSSNKDGGASGSGGGGNDMIVLSKILQKGFESVSNTISSKLESVGDKLTSGLDNLQDKLDEKMEELTSFKRDDDGDSDIGPSDSVSNWDTLSQQSQQLPDRASTHALSACSTDSKGKSFFKKKNKPAPQDALGDDIDQDLAEITDRCFNKPVGYKRFKDIKDKYLRPRNVTWLQVPEVPTSALPISFMFN